MNKREWEMKTIKILVDEGSGPLLKRTWALVSGNVAIHTTSTDMGPDWRRYNLTHIPTGTRIGPPGLMKSQLQTYLDYYNNYKWRDVRVIDMPACEIVQVYDLILEDKLNQEDRNLKKEQAIKQAIATVHNCE